MVEPRLNQKVKLITGEVGNIHKIYPPCEEHSGRIIVYIPTKRRPMFKEFWFSDLGETLFLVDKEKAEENKLPLTASIRDLYPELSVRTFYVLYRAGKKTIADVLNCTPTEVANIRNMGRKSFEEIQEIFSKYGKFREEGETNE